jgi:hypothetical protein
LIPAGLFPLSYGFAGESPPRLGTSASIDRILGVRLPGRAAAFLFQPGFRVGDPHRRRANGRFDVQNGAEFVVAFAIHAGHARRSVRKVVEQSGEPACASPFDTG